MDLQTLENHCLSKKGATKDFPFGDDVAVYRVMGKIFALIPLNESLRINLKCDPTLVQMLRQTYPAVTPGYHMNKTHWNTVLIDGTIPDDEIAEMVDHAYDTVVKGLTKRDRAQLDTL